MPFYTDPVTKADHKFAWSPSLRLAFSDSCSSHCIRGHRSTNCSHNDRPLFYIRKKGRPVSQCTQCRALRKNRSLHTRCDCPSRVQNKGFGNSNDYADLPHGMTIDAAKAFIEGLSSDQGIIFFPCDAKAQAAAAIVILIDVNVMPERLLALPRPRQLHLLPHLIRPTFPPPIQSHTLLAFRQAPQHKARLLSTLYPPLSIRQYPTLPACLHLMSLTPIPKVPSQRHLPHRYLPRYNTFNAGKNI